MKKHNLLGISKINEENNVFNNFPKYWKWKLPPPRQSAKQLVTYAGAAGVGAPYMVLSRFERSASLDTYLIVFCISLF